VGVVDHFADESPNGTTITQEEKGAGRSTSIRVGLQSLIRLADGVASQEKGVANAIQNLHTLLRGITNFNGCSLFV
jgi:hypothetical protein